jgi:PKD domain/Right handed beta helix region
MLYRAVASLTLAALLPSLSPAALIRPAGFDSQALQVAFQQARPGDTVQLAAGTYRLTDALRPVSGVHVIGSGQDKTLLIYVGTKMSAMAELDDCTNVEMARMTFDGKLSPVVNQGIVASNSRRLWLHHLTIRNLANVKDFGPHAIYFTGDNPTMRRGVTDSKITNCTIENIGVGAKFGDGIRMAWGSVRNEVLDNTIHVTGRGGIFGDHSEALIIRNNKVSESGGEGMGIEIWGHCPHSVIEDNEIDHWLSVDSSNQSAVRRNKIGTQDGTLKSYGIEVIARDVIVTDNIVWRGQRTGLNVSNTPVRNNVFWGYNSVSDCIQWGAQLQGETGGIAHHYFYRCQFASTVRGDPRAKYPDVSGNGFRTNGNCKGLVLEDCLFRSNGGNGVELFGADIDRLSFVRCAMIANKLAAVTQPSQPMVLAFENCRVLDNGNNNLPAGKPFDGPAPTASFDHPQNLRPGVPVLFKDTSRPASGEIVERLWDFGAGIPQLSAEAPHTFARPGRHRITLIVWDSAGRGARAEKTIEVH